MAGFQQPITIHQALERINRNAYLLPAFQREFVWRSSQIERLFDSIMKGYPISSMLFWKVEDDKAKAEFRFYKFLNRYVQHHKTHNEVFATDQTKDFHAILDGQQRLTALYIGLCGSYAYKEYKKHSTYSEANYPTRHLYLNISSLYSEGESDMLYKFSFLDKAESGERDLFLRDGQNWFRVGRILSLRKEDALDEFLDEFVADKEAKKIIRRLDKIIHNESIINYYEEDEQKPDKAVNVFVRINSGGTYLSFSDILMSITIANWKKDARTEIHDLVDAVNRKGFSISKDYILKAFLFLYHRDVRFQITNFKNDFIQTIEQNWERIRDAIASLFDLLKTFGLNNYTLTANNATLPILYYIYHCDVYDQFATRTGYADDRDAIRKWLYAILVRRTFGGQSDTVLAQARRAFTTKIDEASIRELIAFPAEAINKEIKKVTDIGDDYLEEILLTQKDTQYSFPILALLYPNMDYKNNNFHQDHLHPAAEYNSLSDEDKQKYGWEVYNSVLNLQMLDANENMSKNDTALNGWIAVQLNKQLPVQFFTSKLIPVDVSYELKDFGSFIEKRKHLLKEKLKNILN